MLTLIALTALVVTPAEVPFTNPAPGKTSLSMNLAGPADWSSELPFVDMFRYSRPWISQQEGKAWGQGPKLDIDEHGWVRKLPPNAWAETVITSLNGHYPGGNYTVLYDGKGRIEFNEVATILSQTPGRMVIRVDPKRGSWFLRLRETQPANPVRNIRLIMPGHEKTYRTDPFRPEFLRRWKGVSCLRFMDWMGTNNSTIEKWEDRPRLDDASWAVKGIPAEILVSLANRIGADAWFCMPHRADDGYVRNFAKLVKASLRPSIRAYVEYSNEVWNSGFQQCEYAGKMGLAAKIGEKPWDAGWRFYARRSTQMFKIWERVFGGSKQLVRVMATQSVNPYISEQELNFEGAAKHTDALAIAPYFGFTPSPESKPSSEEVSKWNLDQVFRHVESISLPEAFKAMDDQKKCADKYGIALIAYEGGQHLVGVAGGENNDRLTELFLAANRDPRMGHVYTRYLDHWKIVGGGMFGNFSSIGGWSKWGSWGLMEFEDENPANSPKLSAVARWAQSLGQPVGK